MLSDTNEFFIDVVSNGSMDTYPDNTLSKFINKLPQTIHLEGEWVVGVHEIFYPITYDKPKVKIDFSLLYRAYDGNNFSGAINEIIVGEDDLIRDIFDKLNQKFQELVNNDEVEKVPKTGERIPPKIEHLNNKVVITPGSTPSGRVMPMFLDREIQKKLGITDQDFFLNLFKVMQGKLPVLQATSVSSIGTRSHLLFIYTDIIHEHFVGDTKARLIKVVPLTKGLYESIGYMSITKAFYYPVRVRDLSTITILLADENGQEIKFTDGRTHISLHFKRKEVV